MFKDSLHKVPIGSKTLKDGFLGFATGNLDFDFPIARVYFHTNMSVSASRGDHAHRKLKRIFIALAGSFELHLNDGVEERVVTLNRPSEGLYVGPMVWLRLRKFSPGAVSIALASDGYDEEDYIRDFQSFMRLANK